MLLGIALPHDRAIDSDARKRCTLPGARHRGRYTATESRHFVGIVLR